MSPVKKCTIGIDEVGRGPVAGPVAVCAFVIPDEHKKQAFEMLSGVKDSKRMSAKKREGWFATLETSKKEGIVDFATSFINADEIDTNGIVPSINKAVRRSLKKLDVQPSVAELFLDGGLRAPHTFVHQKTVHHGEDKYIEIAAASVVAKVLRDRRMVVYAKEFPQYGFERHKGYGTIAHYEALGKHGPCAIHRVSFL